MLNEISIHSRVSVPFWRLSDLLEDQAGAHARMLFAIVLVAIGVIVVTGLDKQIETLAVNESPQWLTDLTTRF